MSPHESIRPIPQGANLAATALLKIMSRLTTGAFGVDRLNLAPDRVIEIARQIEI